MSNEICFIDRKCAMSNKICCFAGHSSIFGEEDLPAKLKKEIVNLIENHNVATFYNGGKGDFDWLCAHMIDDLKKDYLFIKSYYILSYMPKEKDEYDNTLKIFDDTIYPDIEKIPPKFAIIKRNKWMVKNSDFLIAYVENHFAGAYKTLQYAEKKKNIKIINLVDEKIQKEFQEWFKKINSHLTSNFYNSIVIIKPLHRNLMFVFGAICSTKCPP